MMFSFPQLRRPPRSIWTSLLMLGVFLGCRSDSSVSPSTTSLTVITKTEGGVIDADGYSVLFDDGVSYVPRATVGANSSVTISDLPMGPLMVDLSGLAPNCFFKGPIYPPLGVDIRSGQNTSVTVEVSCIALPGGSYRIAFTCHHWNQYLPSSPGICILNSDGSIVGLSNNAFVETEPAWSPDGQKIAFTSTRDGFPYMAIYVMDQNGSNVVRLTNPVANVRVRFPSWSPDGTKILFASNLGGDSEIFVVNADGSNLVQLTNNTIEDDQPRFSPDGSKIVFASNRDAPAEGLPNGKWEIYEMNADGTAARRLTNDAAIAQRPTYFKNGAKILFDSDRLGARDIYVMNADGSGITRLTNNPWDSYFPVPSPDETHIMFTSGGVNGYDEIYVMNADGTLVEPLTRQTSLYESNVGYSYRR